MGRVRNGAHQTTHEKWARISDDASPRLLVEQCVQSEKQLGALMIGTQEVAELTHRIL